MSSSARLSGTQRHTTGILDALAEDQRRY